jgi:Virulence protein
MEQSKEQTGEIVMYQPDETIRLEVRMDNETVWLTQQQMAELFGTKRQAITKHLQNIYDSEELKKKATSSILELVRKEGNRTVKRKIEFYNLDAIISVGFRVNTKRGIEFRQWANNVLKQYMLRGYVVNTRIATLEQHATKTDVEIEELKSKVDFFVRSSLPPVEGIFYEGQIFDAYNFASDLMRKAKKSIVLIDNYVDDTVLALLDKRKKGVSATIYTHIGQQLQLDIKRHNEQYAPVEVVSFNKAHDRFLLIDDEVYHIGASIKDLGKKWFAFSLLHDITADELKEKLK